MPQSPITDAELREWAHDADADIELLPSEVVQAMAAELLAARTRLARVDTLLTREDGSEYQHNLPNCLGEDDCPACWSTRILVALDPGGDIQAAQQAAEHESTPPTDGP